LLFYQISRIKHLVGLYFEVVFFFNRYFYVSRLRLLDQRIESEFMTTILGIALSVLKRIEAFQ